MYVTDWTDARRVPLSEGQFSLEDYTGYIIEFLQETGTGTHLKEMWCRRDHPLRQQQQSIRPLPLLQHFWKIYC